MPRSIRVISSSKSSSHIKQRSLPSQNPFQSYNLFALCWSYSRRSAPLVLGCQDKHFLIDEEPAQFPKLSTFACFFVSNILTRRHANLWRFNPCNIYGTPKKLPPASPPSVESETAFVYNQVSSPLEARNMQLFVLMIVLFLSVSAAYFGLGGIRIGVVGESDGGEKVANFSTRGGIVWGLLADVYLSYWAVLMAFGDLEIAGSWF